jgi:hypothetical protein
MSDIVLREPELVSRLERLARENQTTPEQLLRLAVDKYLDDVGRQKLRREVQAFQTMHSELLKQYYGYSVAVHNSRVIDSDKDARSLYLRIRERYGNTPILIRLVNEQAENEMVFRSPRFQHNLP